MSAFDPKRTSSAPRAVSDSRVARAVVNWWDAALASVYIKRGLDLRGELVRLASSFFQSSEQNPGEYQDRRAFAESLGPEELLGLHHCTRS
jgi:hypothetical protein